MKKTVYFTRKFSCCPKTCPHKMFTAASVQRQSGTTLQQATILRDFFFRSFFQLSTHTPRPSAFPSLTAG